MKITFINVRDTVRKRIRKKQKFTIKLSRKNRCKLRWYSLDAATHHSNYGTANYVKNNDNTVQCSWASSTIIVLNGDTPTPMMTARVLPIGQSQSETSFWYTMHKIKARFLQPDGEKRITPTHVLWPEMRRIWNKMVLSNLPKSQLRHVLLQPGWNFGKSWLKYLHRRNGTQHLMDSF